MLYTNLSVVVKFENFHVKKKNIVLSFAHNIDTSTHNLCFRAKIRKIGIPLHTQVLLV